MRKLRALARLGNVDDLARAMVERREFCSWSARAPWAVFGLGSLLLLAGAYFVACIYLWSLWQVFLPGADTPFGRTSPGPIYSFQNICIQTGKYYYIGAPIFAGWAMAVVAGRQRVKAVWLAIGLALIAWMGSTAEIHASRSAVPRGLGHISMSFGAGGSVEGSVLYAAGIFALTTLPYLVWRLRANALPAWE